MAVELARVVVARFPLLNNYEGYSCYVYLREGRLYFRRIQRESMYGQFRIEDVDDPTQADFACSVEELRRAVDYIQRRVVEKAYIGSGHLARSQRTHTRMRFTAQCSETYTVNTSDIEEIVRLFC